jgi:hypothetical protein
MLDSTELLLESVLETQLKLKIFHSCKDLPCSNTFSLAFTKMGIVKIFLSLLYLINFKKVVSGKARNRVVLKNLEKFIFLLDSPENTNWKKNENFLEFDYTCTQYINSLYEICVKSKTG